jgi:hypothetical protein
MKHSSKHKLNISKPLTLFATLVVTKKISHHGRPIKTGSTQQPPLLLDQNPSTLIASP